MALEECTAVSSPQSHEQEHRRVYLQSYAEINSFLPYQQDEMPMDNLIN